MSTFWAQIAITIAVFVAAVTCAFLEWSMLALGLGALACLLAIANLIWPGSAGDIGG